MKILTLGCAALAVLSLAGCAGTGKRPASIAAAVSEAGRKRDFGAISKMSASIPDSDLSPERLKEYSAGDFNVLCKTLRTIAFYLPDEEGYALRLEKVFNEKVRRGTYVTDDVEDMFTAFAQARLFEKAKSVKSRFPAILLTDVPEISAPAGITSGNWLVYDISEGGKKAELKRLPLGEGPKIVVAMSPGCGPLGSAAKDIFSDAELGPIFRANAIMLTRNFDPAGVEEFKKTYSFPAVYLAHKSGDFPGLDLMFSPHFYFLKDGKIMSDLRGWASDDVVSSKERLRKGLRAIGLAGAASH